MRVWCRIVVELEADIGVFARRPCWLVSRPLRFLVREARWPSPVAPRRTYRWPACNLPILASRETEKLAYGMRDCIPQPRPALLFLFSGTGRHALAPRSVHDGGISTPILYAVTVYRSTF
jgi:hypothetical protein